MVAGGGGGEEEWLQQWRACWALSGRQRRIALMAALLEQEGDGRRASALWGQEGGVGGREG